MLDFIKTSSANSFSLEFNDVLVRVAEAAVWLVLFQNDLVTVNVNLDRVCTCDAEMLAYFLWHDYSSELINISDNTCRFHSTITFPGSIKTTLYAHFTTFAEECQDFFRRVTQIGGTIADFCQISADF